MTYQEIREALGRFLAQDRGESFTVAHYNEAHRILYPHLTPRSQTESVMRAPRRERATGPGRRVDRVPPSTAPGYCATCGTTPPDGTPCACFSRHPAETAPERPADEAQNGGTRMNAMCANHDECDQHVRIGSPETLAECLAGHALYCQGCLEALPGPAQDEASDA